MNSNSWISADVVEFGYRTQPHPRLSWSITAFQHDFVELVRSQISGARFATPTVKTKCQSWIKIKILIIDGAPTFGTVAVRTRHQSIESVVNFSQTCLEQFSPFVKKGPVVLEQCLANIFAFSVEAVPN